MKNPTRVREYARVKLKDGSQPYLDSVWAANRQMKKGRAVHNGTPKHFPHAVYYRRYARPGEKRGWERLTDDPAQAGAAKQQMLVSFALGFAQRALPEGDRDIAYALSSERRYLSDLVQGRRQVARQIA